MLSTIFSVLTLVLTAYSVNLAMGSPPTKIAKGKQVEDTDAFPGFLVFLRKVMEIAR
jgi:hypothetical protein